MILAAMTISAAGLSFVAHWEGEVLHVYTDAAGVATIGVGHALKAGESFPSGITHAQALALLAQDIHVAESAVNEHVTTDVTQSQFDAMVSLAFNVGGGAFADSTLVRKLNAGDTQGAADEFLSWDHRRDPRTGELVIDPWLLRRREAERELFLSEDMAPNATALLEPDDTIKPG